MPEGQNPGSISSFEQQHPDLSPEEVLRLWENEMGEYRSSLAGVLGITVEELHGHDFELSNDKTGNDEQINGSVAA